MLRISFPFRFFEVGERNCTSFEKKMIADISSVLAEIRVQRKRKNKDIAVAQKVYCILLRIYSSGLANLNLANLYMSTSSTGHSPRNHFKWVATSLWWPVQIWNVNWSRLSSLSQSPVLKLDNLYVPFCNVLWNVELLFNLYGKPGG